MQTAPDRRQPHEVSPQGVERVRGPRGAYGLACAGLFAIGIVSRRQTIETRQGLNPQGQSPAPSGDRPAVSAASADAQPSNEIQALVQNLVATFGPRAAYFGTEAATADGKRSAAAGGASGAVVAGDPDGNYGENNYNAHPVACRACVLTGVQA